MVTATFSAGLVQRRVLWLFLSYGTFCQGCTTCNTWSKQKHKTFFFFFLHLLDVFHDNLLHFSLEESKIEDEGAEKLAMVLDSLTSLEVLK